MTVAVDDERFMRQALRLAKRASGRTSPNPVVGAVVVRSGKVVGTGYHRAAGKPHAEVIALRSARNQARGAVIYTTLEPCAHQGRTPPCVAAIRRAGIKRVVAAMRDPDPRTNGRGFRALRHAGIAVATGVLEQDAAAVNEGFTSRVRRGRPFVVVKLAMTLDGRVGVHGRRYLSGAKALRFAHRLRDQSDAILVGIGTVLADDPELTVRAVRGRDPLRVIVDSGARTPVNAKVLGRDRSRTVIFVGKRADQRRTQALRATGTAVVVLPSGAGGLSLRAALRWLGRHGINTVLSEAGPRVASTLVREGLADRLLLVYVPIAGGSGPHALPDRMPSKGYRNLRARRLGGDVALVADL